MSTEHFMTWPELLLLQGYLGLPVYLINGILQGIYLKKVENLSNWPTALPFFSSKRPQYLFGDFGRSQVGTFKFSRL